MKLLKFVAIVFIVTLSFVPSVSAQNELSLQAEFSLFYESHKNGDFESALPHGWIVVNKDPSAYIRFRIFPRMEEILWYMHDSVATTDEEKIALTDTCLYLYEKAIESDEKRRGHFYVRKAYVIEVWQEPDAEEVIAAYEKAFDINPEATPFYKDRLGQVYANNAADENDYKIKALELYSKLQESDPENALWNSRIEALAEDMSELVNILEKAWQLDKENPEKAWKYANICMKAQEYERAIVPFVFLTEKLPDVVNYWKQLASAYDKIDNMDKAISSYKKLINLEPDKSDNYVNIALVYKKLDQLSVARSYLQKASKANPSSDYPAFIEAQLYEQVARNCLQVNSIL